MRGRVHPGYVVDNVWMMCCVEFQFLLISKTVQERLYASPSECVYVTVAKRILHSCIGAAVCVLPWSHEFKHVVRFAAGKQKLAVNKKCL